MDLEQLAEWSRLGERRLDPQGKIVVNQEGHVVFNFGKNKGLRCSANWSYLEWMLKADFAEATKAVVRRLLEGGAA